MLFDAVVMNFTFEILEFFQNFVHYAIGPLNYFKMIPKPTAGSVSPGRGLLIPHGYIHPNKMAGASLCFMGGPPIELKNMADRQDWKGQSFLQEKHVRKLYNKKVFHTI